MIERKDQIINLCEMKYSIAEFSIDKNYSQTLRNKVGAFRNETKTKKAIHLTMVTTFGIKPNEYAGIVQNEVVIDDLF